MKTTTNGTPSTHKVRRRALGGKPANGHQRQRENRRIRRGDPGRIHRGRDDDTLTAVGGLVDFGIFTRQIGLEHELGKNFGRLKTHGNVVYGMPQQLRMLIDSELSGCGRIFHIEAMAGDPLFTYLAGGDIPSIDTIYTDLRRFDPKALGSLERIVYQQGLADVRPGMFKIAHLDIDTSVVPLFGEQQGAEVGHNPRYRGRPSYHPIIARLAETHTIVGATLRPGDEGFGNDEAANVTEYISRVRKAVGPNCLLYVRIDGAADCLCIMRAIDKTGSLFITKADMTPDLCGAIAVIERWKTVERDADGSPIVQIAEVDFQRNVWVEAKQSFRVFAVRSSERLNGKRISLWKDNDFTVQAFITNDRFSDGDDLAKRYDGRAGIEPLIGELKGHWNIGKMPSDDFNANHALFLIKLLTLNLMRRWVRARHPRLLRWRTDWVRRALVLRPGRLLTFPGRRRVLRMAPRPVVAPMRC